MSILSLIVLALLGEAIWETSKMVWQNGKVSVDRIGSLVIAMLLVFGSSLDLMALVGIPLHIPFLGLIFTGILVSRGANFMHDLLVRIEGIKEIKDVFPQNADQQNTSNAEIKQPQSQKLVEGEQLGSETDQEKATMLQNLQNENSQLKEQNNQFKSTIDTITAAAQAVQSTAQ